jgi:hypothetical protein
MAAITNKSSLHVRNQKASISEFAPALVIVLTTFLAICSLTEVLAFDLAVQRACVDAARTAASSLTVKLAKESVKNSMNQFNSNPFKKLIDPKAEHDLRMSFSYSQTKPAGMAPAQTRYVRVQGEASIAPFGIPMEFKIAPSAECALEYPEGWTNENEKACRF